MTEVKYKLETVILIPTRVKSIREEFKHTSSYSQSLGWFAQFEGSRESLFVGDVKPAELNVDDEVFIAIQKPRRK